MDNTSEYINILPFDIKLIIESKLSVALLLKLKIQDRVAELIFKYRYPETYFRFKNIIRVNKSLDFGDYVSEGPHFWHVVLKDELSYEFRYSSFWRPIGPVLSSWEYSLEYMNPIGITMHCLSDLYHVYPKIYKHLSIFIHIPIGIMLFNDSLEDVVSYNSDQNLDDFLITGELSDCGIGIGIDADSNTLQCMIVVYFLLHLIEGDKINIDYSMIDYVMENVNRERFMSDHPGTYARYIRYENIYNDVYKYVDLHR